MHRSLSEYIALLEREGELVRITAPVSPVEEIAEITDRVSKMPGGGKALLFENTGTEFPVLTNMFGSARRMALALGVGSLGELSERVDGLLRQAMAPRRRSRTSCGRCRCWLGCPAGSRVRCRGGANASRSYGRVPRRRSRRFRS